MELLGNLAASLTLLLAHLTLLRAHREHKVHNIVLYPDKESWCKTTPIKQVVTWPQCSSQELDNNVCVGACFSYMVPHSEPSAPGDLIRPYCDSCQPLDSIWHTVTLDCRDKDDNPTTMQKKVQIITNCSCSSCMESSRIKPDFNSLLQSLELESARLPAAAAASSVLTSADEQQPVSPQPTQQPTPEQQPQPEGQAAPAASPAPEAAPTQAPEAQAAGAGEAGPSGPTPEATEAAAGPPPDAHETPDLLLDPNLNGSRSIGAAATAAPQAAADRILQMLKQDEAAKLGGLQKLQKLEKLATEYEGGTELVAKLSELLRKFSKQEEREDPALGDAVGPVASEDQLQREGVPATTSLAPPPPLPEDDEEVPSLQDQQLRVAASLMHRTGPHHSLVLDSGVKEKIDVESHYLHPALAGQEISYHDNGLLDKTKKKDF